MLQVRKLLDPIKTFALNGAFLADTFPYQRAGSMIQDACLGKDINLEALDCVARGMRQEYTDRDWNR